MPDNDVIELDCKRCGEKVCTKELDSSGQTITEVLCWNCISLDMEARNTQRCLHDIKTTSKTITKEQKTIQKSYRGLAKEVFKRLPDQFNNKDIFALMNVIYKERKDAVYKHRTLEENKRHIRVLGWRWVRRWADRGVLVQHKPGQRGTFFTKVVKNNEQNR